MGEPTTEATALLPGRTSAEGLGLPSPRTSCHNSQVSGGGQVCGQPIRCPLPHPSFEFNAQLSQTSPRLLPAGTQPPPHPPGLPGKSSLHIALATLRLRQLSQQPSPSSMSGAAAQPPRQKLGPFSAPPPLSGAATPAPTCVQRLPSWNTPIPSSSSRGTS
ncbi:calpain-15-like [Sturnira hondurensis]|uniref:calpain-15-like n=1 Tax=Sturnira hondurensis TaxID=192404 RepID=UPI0018794F4D|nr:calpain-15-like [Sturnira hondurensis]